MHPRISLFRISVEQLQVHALQVQDAPLLPQRVQRCAVAVQRVQRRLHLRRAAVSAFHERFTAAHARVHYVLAGVHLALLVNIYIWKTVTNVHVLSC